MNSLQKLSLVLLVPIILTFTFSLYQIRNIYHFIDQIPLRLEKSTLTSHRLSSELTHLESLEENLRRSSDRHSELLLGVDVRLKSSFSQGGLKSWRSKAGLLRAQLNQDLDHLQRFTDRTNSQLNKLALSLKSLLLQEDAQWVSLQRFLSKQASENNSGNSKQFYQNYMREFLETIRAISIFREAVNKYKVELQASVSNENMNLMKLDTRSRSYQDSLQHYVIVIITCLVMGIIASCGAYGLRIRRERRSRERRKTVRNVAHERRKVDRN